MYISALISLAIAMQWAQPQSVLRAHEHEVATLAICGDLLISGGGHGGVIAWNTQTNEQVATFAVTNDLPGERDLRDAGVLWAGCIAGTQRVVAVRGETAVTFSLDGRERSRTTLDLRPTERVVASNGRLAVSTFRTVDAEHFRVWDLSDGAFLRRCDTRPFLAQQTSQVAHVDNGRLKLISYPNGEVQQLVAGGRVTLAEFSPSGRLIAAADATGMVQVWDVTSGKVLARHQLKGHPVRDGGLVFDQAEQRLAISCWEYAAIIGLQSGASDFELPTGCLVVWLNEHHAWGVSQKHALRDHVELWDLSSRSRIRAGVHRDEVTAWAVNEHGLLATGSGGNKNQDNVTIRLWPKPKGK